MNSTKPFVNRNYDSDYFLDIMLNETDECIVFVDKDGLIVELNHPYASFLGVIREEAIGKPVTEVIENTRLMEVMKTRKPEFAQAHKIKGTSMIANRVPIIRNGEVEGAFDAFFLRM